MTYRDTGIKIKIENSELGFTVTTLGNSSQLLLENAESIFFNRAFLPYLQNEIEKVLNVRVLSVSVVPLSYDIRREFPGNIQVLNKATICFVHEPKASTVCCNPKDHHSGSPSNPIDGYDAAG